MAEPQAPRSYGTYQVERELGRGGMGVVYAATHEKLGKRVAIKVLLEDVSRDRELLERFENEARAAGAIEHPGIVDIHDVGTADGVVYIVMELLQGESLAARLKSRGAMPLAVAIGLARQCANALEAAHLAGIVHRDLKPDNVFLVPDAEVVGGERVKLLDFGVAKLVGDQTSSVARTVTGAILGTPHYMSPEQCEGAREVDARSDLYSLGCMLFQMVTGRLPFQSAGIGGLIGMHLHVPPPTLRSMRPDAPVELEALVAKLLAKSPEDRMQTAGEVSAALANMPTTPSTSATAVIPVTPLPPVVEVGSQTVATVVRPSDPTLLASPPVSPPATAEPMGKSRPRRWVWPAIALAAVAVAVIAVAGRRDRDPDPQPPIPSPDPERLILQAQDRAKEPVVVDVPREDPPPTPATPAPPPSNITSAIEVAKIKLANKNFEGAILDAQYVLKIDPRNVEALAIETAAKTGRFERLIGRMRTNLTAGRYAAIGKDRDLVFATSTEPDRRAKAEALWTETKVRWRADIKRRATRLGEAAKCAELDALATEVAHLGIDFVPLQGSCADTAAAREKQAELQRKINKDLIANALNRMRKQDPQTIVSGCKDLIRLDRLQVQWDRCVKAQCAAFPQGVPMMLVNAPPEDVLNLKNLCEAAYPSPRAPVNQPPIKAPTQAPAPTQPTN